MTWPISPTGRQAIDLKSIKYGFESHIGHHILYALIFFCFTVTPIFKDTLDLKIYSLSYIDWETYIDMNREEGDQE